MIKGIMTLVLIPLFILSYGDKPYEWLKTLPFGSSCFNRYLIETVDNGYIVLLYKAHSGPPGITSYLIRTDINGLILWYKTFSNGVHSFNLKNVEKTYDRGFILTGSSTKSGNPDPIVIKLNSCGNVEWCTFLYTPAFSDYACRVRQLPSGDYIVLTSYSDVAQNSRIQLYKLNTSGKWLWKRNYPAEPPAGSDDGKDVTVLSDGFLISANCYAPDPGMPISLSYERPYFIRTDTAGNVMWRTVYGMGNGFHGNLGYNAVVGPSGHFFYATMHSNYCDTPALIKCMADSTEGYFQDVIPNSCPGSCGSLNFFDDTTLVIRASGKIGGVWHVKWIRMDTLGIEHFSKSIADNPYIGASGWSIVTHDKKIVGLSKHNNVNYLFKLNAQFEYDSVYSYPYVYDSLCPYPIVSDTIDPVCDLLVGSPEKTMPEIDTRLRVWPNPAYDRVQVEAPPQLEIPEKDGGSITYNRWGQCRLEVYSLSGRIVHSCDILQNNRVLDIPVTDWPRGMYLFRLSYRGATCASAIVALYHP